MKFAWVGAFCVILLSSCALTRQSSLPRCSRDASFSRGAKDGVSGHNFEQAFLRSCSPESRGAARLAYREGFGASHVREEGKIKLEKIEVTGEILPEIFSISSPLPESASIAWVCEVEANSKIFTGVGGTRDEALGSARSTCGSHFRASYCQKSDCRQNL